MLDKTVNAIRHIDLLTAFGLLAVSLMLMFYALEDRSPLCVLAFAGACIMGSAYGFLQGAWPFGFVEAVWSVVALRRWWQSRQRKIYNSKITSEKISNGKISDSSISSAHF
jgi:hypothetical protein